MVQTVSVVGSYSDALASKQNMGEVSTSSAQRMAAMVQRTVFRLIDMKLFSFRNPDLIYAFWGPLGA